MSVPFGQSQEQHEQALQGLAEQLAKQIKSEQDITALSKQLLKLTVESALQGELEEHLGYAKHAVEGRGSVNSRNGHSKKTVKSNLGEIELRTPRDRQGSFEYSNQKVQNVMRKCRARCQSKWWEAVRILVPSMLAITVYESEK